MSMKRFVTLSTVGLALACGLLATASGSAQDRSYTLEQLTALALERNPAIAAGAMEVEARESAYRAARRFFNPDLEFRLGRAESHDALNDRKTLAFALTQTIESPFKRGPRVGMERNSWEESVEAQSSRVMEVVFDIRARFYALLLLREKHRLLRRISDSVRETAALVRKRAELGEVKPLDPLKLEVEVLKTEQEAAAVRAERETVREALNALLDNGLPADFEAAGELAFERVALDEAALVDRALAGHPLIRAQAKRLERLRNSVRLVKGRRFPDLALTGFSDSGLDGVNRGVGLSLSVPLWNFGSHEIAEAASSARAGEQELKAARLELAAEIRASVRRVRLAEEKLAVFTTALLRQVEESLGIAEVAYREGEISLLEFLDTQRTYNTVLGDYHQALFDWNVEMAALEKAAGEKVR